MNILNSIIWMVLVSGASVIIMTEPFSPPPGKPVGDGKDIEEAVEWDDFYASSAYDSIFQAVRTGDINSVRRYISQGVDLNQMDEAGWTPLDHAMKNSRKDIRNLLLENGAVTFPKTIKDMYEGPHVRVIDSLTFEVMYLKHDSIGGSSGISGDTIAFIDLPAEINGITVTAEDFDPACYQHPPAAIYTDADRIFVVGDMHGEYSRTIELLTRAGIVDSEGNWSWGRGHLVFMGDIFDRGDEVTEALWMIFRLEKQATEKGGMVHMVLGNHEPMIFNEDLRYITKEYYSLCDNLGLGYSGLYDNKSLLGSWLRQKPVVLRINGYVFVHGGFSPEILDKGVTLDTINHVVWRHLNDRKRESDSALISSIMGASGVLWYRGMVNENSRDDIIDNSSLTRALDMYMADMFIVGHTEVDSIKYYFDGRVTDVNIPKRKLSIPEQGLLIRGRNLFVIDQYGVKKRLIRVKRRIAFN